MATITGFIEKIKFRNEENGYTVLSVTDQSDGDEVIMVGTLSYAAEGDMIQASGRMIEHPVYGEQLQIESYEMKTPQDAESMERYLGSGAIKGIGVALAARIVRHFKADTFRVMEEEPERLSEVKGISEKMAMAIAEQVEEKKGMREAMMFLQNYGITLNLAAKIYQEYGPKLYSIIKENPYKLADDIPGVGFKMADEIAEKVGIFTDSDYRIRAGLLYILLQASANGHTYLPQKELFSQAAELLKVETTAMEKHLMEELPFMATENILMYCVKHGGDRQQVHEIIRKASMEATAQMKNGERWDLIAALSAEPAFGMTEEEIKSHMEPSQYIGRCPEQVHAFTAKCRALCKNAESCAEEISL